ncbi:MAG: hypothetical protein OEW25_02175 [Nitrospira sp.]|jgi:hypothetical protein|nr:hypothetical protein [Nitrospira sp.]MDH4327671.1 hypothetical protein [Nitrospira sp.]MDH5252106.1 hypothetical protein [Nitrospira sp.]
MKRIAMGLLWSLILYFGIVGIGGALIGAMAGSGGKNVQQGYRAEYAAGEAFSKQYGTFILIVAASGAALGTVTGRLPGTRSKKS